jgi:hypothetical protein
MNNRQIMLRSQSTDVYSSPEQVSNQSFNMKMQIRSMSIMNSITDDSNKNGISAQSLCENLCFDFKEEIIEEKEESWIVCELQNSNESN